MKPLQHTTPVRSGNLATSDNMGLSSIAICVHHDHVYLTVCKRFDHFQRLLNSVELQSLPCSRRSRQACVYRSTIDNIPIPADNDLLASSKLELGTAQCLICLHQKLIQQDASVTDKTVM